VIKLTGDSKDVLSIENVVAGYGSFQVIGPITFSAETGNVVVIHGPNGVGKSTFMKTLATLLKPIEGNIYLNKRPISKCREVLFYLPESIDTVLPLEVTVLDYLRIISSTYGLGWDRREIVEILEVFGLPRSEPIRLLSQGQKRRLQLASTVVVRGQARVYILDDPSIGLDDISKKMLLPGIIRELKEKAIIIISTRDYTFAESIKDLTNLTIDAVKYSRVVPKPSTSSHLEKEKSLRT